MKKMSIILIFCIMGVFLMGFTNSDNTIAQSKAKMLPALEVGGKPYSPEKGVKLSLAREMIIKYLQNKGVKGDIGSSVKVNEITLKEAWDNNRFQLYRVELDYSGLYGVAIIRDGKVLSVLDGMPTWKVFLADLDSDSRYEIYTEVSFGSGIVSNEIRGYNIASGIGYNFSIRAKKDLYLFILNKTLWVKETPYSDRGNESSSIGRLALKSAKDKYGLYIKAVKPSETRNNLYPVIPKFLTIDMVGSGKQVKISDAKVIKKITGILNSVELRPFPKAAELGLRASSLGGLKITADSKENESIYVHGAGAVYLNASEGNNRRSNIVFQIPKNLINTLYEIINKLQGPPELKITLDNKNIGYKVKWSKWNGVVCEGEDAFKSILKKSANTVPYIKLGKTITIEFKKSRPDTVEIYDYILTKNGDRKYDDRSKVRIPATIKDGKCSFKFKGNPASMLSSNSEDYKPGRTLRGFQVICKWSNKSADECEYGFVIRTDASIK
ncbi:MAG TPA: hypothetical protein VHT34_10105 [Clostridia bacterium]|nr:hypothetical protein [Clostridia bacterium]